jgi:hypothetical protein
MKSFELASSQPHSPMPEPTSPVTMTPNSEVRERFSLDPEVFRARFRTPEWPGGARVRLLFRHFGAEQTVYLNGTPLDRSPIRNRPRCSNSSCRKRSCS